MLGEGVVGARAPSEDEARDIAFGWPTARAIAAEDVGQTVVVRDRAVMALEAIEGSDSAIERGAALGGPGCVVVKVAKPQQDRRFDVPVVGAATIDTLVRAGATALAVEADETVLLERDEAIARADAAGISLVATRDGKLPALDASGAGGGS